MRKIYGPFLVISLVALGLGGLSCGDDESNPVNPPGGGTPADVTIQIVADAGSGAYSPSPDTVSVGKTVSWHNNRGTAHTATADGGQWDTGSIGPGATSAPRQMNTAGVFTYHCTFHGTMTGTLRVE